jgi:hypothetical protein
MAGRLQFNWGICQWADGRTLTHDEAKRTLVLLTRHYPDLPQQFTFEQRQYWQPSRKIPVSTWDCRPFTTVDLAYELGIDDARKV